MQSETLSQHDSPPELSLVLLDWRVRESFHTLEYLAHQRADRASFEVIWVEFYDHRPPKLVELIDRYRRLGLPPPIDRWIILQRPEEEIYHKHEMYNVGILNARGRILSILDSDAILHTTFIQTVLDEFRRRPNLVLHFEQIRNFDPKYHPFSFPVIDEIIGPGCVNATDGVPHGFETCAKSLREDWDLWHRYNYGACMCAAREDILRIGGADEHEDYLGYICGPYEITARMINAGYEDLLHPTHYLYHVYHPHQGGGGPNHAGPNDGRGMSLTAMELRHSGRVMPLKENPQIRSARAALGCGR